MGWPDFKSYDLLKALDAYANVERRFGKTGDQIPRKHKFIGYLFWLPFLYKIFFVQNEFDRSSSLPI